MELLRVADSVEKFSWSCFFAKTSAAASELSAAAGNEHHFGGKRCGWQQPDADGSAAVPSMYFDQTRNNTPPVRCTKRPTVASQVKVHVAPPERRTCSLVYVLTAAADVHQDTVDVALSHPERGAACHDAGSDSCHGWCWKWRRRRWGR